MEDSSRYITLILGAIAIVIWFGFDRLFGPKLSFGEPPVFWSTIPSIGHILGLLRHGHRYYQITSRKAESPIYTLNMLRGKVYIITSPELVNAVNRNSKTLSFNPFIAQLGKRITGHDEATSRIVQHNLDGETGPGYVPEVHDRIVAALMPGTNLDDMAIPMLHEADSYLKTLQAGHDVDLFACMRSMVTMCSTRAIYGPENPFNKDSKSKDLFWDFDHSLDRLIIDALPKLLAPKGSRARSALGLAFQRYFESFSPETSSAAAMVTARYVSATKWGVSIWNQGRLEVGTLLGVLANTIPSSFYTLIHICANPDLLRDVREEVERNAVSVDALNGSRCTLHVRRVRDNCPLLHSTFQEVLRVHALGASTRFVREDTWLDSPDGRYLLKQNSVVQMPMAIMHGNSSIWGPDADAFDPRRFMKQDGESKGIRGSKQSRAAAHRPFGGGAHMCPGRHFVTLEVMILAAYLVTRFDFRPVSGEWRVPEQKQESLATNVFPPKDDIRVSIKNREGWEGNWEFVVN